MKKFWASVVLEHLRFWGWMLYLTAGRQGVTLVIKIGPDEHGMYTDLAKQWGVDA